MSSILEVSVDAEDFALGRTLDAGVDATITLEEAIPTADRAMPYFWAAGENVDEFEASLEDDPSSTASDRPAAGSSPCAFPTARASRSSGDAVSNSTSPSTSGTSTPSRPTGSIRPTV